ncbi:hypothetical protein JCM4914_12480 [Streptomyces platensis subsp. malvinus]
MRQGPSAYGPAGSTGPAPAGDGGAPAKPPSGALPACPMSIAPSPFRAQERTAKNHCTIMQLPGPETATGPLTLET